MTMKKLIYTIILVSAFALAPAGHSAEATKSSSSPTVHSGSSSRAVKQVASKHKKKHHHRKKAQKDQPIEQSKA